MSFLAAEPTEMATLEVTLAFIDSLDWEDSTDISSSSSPSPSFLSSSSVDKHDSPVQSSDDSSGSPLQAINTNIDKRSLNATTRQQPKKRRGQAKRKRCTLSSSTRLQQTKKAELLFLRRRVQELEESLHELKSPKRKARSLLPGSNFTGTLSTSNSMQLANSEYRARLQSEEVNRTLKNILARQVQATNSLREILLKDAHLEPPVLRRDFISVGNESSIMSELQRKTAQLYLDADSVFTSEVPSSIRHSTQVRFDSNRNKVIDIVTVTPVSCSMDIVNKLMEKELNNNRQYPDKWYQTGPDNQPDAMTKKYVIRAHNDVMSTKVSGLQFARKVDETNRTVMTGTDVMLLTTTALRFYLHSWMVITPSESDPLNSSVVLMCFRLSVGCEDQFAVCPGDVRGVMELVLTDMCTRYCQHLQYVQNWLVDETERIAT